MMEAGRANAGAAHESFGCGSSTASCGRWAIVMAFYVTGAKFIVDDPILLHVYGSSDEE